MLMVKSLTRLSSRYANHVLPLGNHVLRMPEVAFMVALFLCGRVIAQTEEYPIRFVSTLGDINISARADLLDRHFEPVHMGIGTNDAIAATPREYLNLISAGYDVKPPYTVYLGSIHQAETLAALTNAKPSRVSHLQDFTLAETNILSILPMDLHANWDDYTEAIAFDAYEQSGLVERARLPRFKDGFPRAYVESMSDTKVVFRSSDESETWISADGVTNSEPTYVRFEVELLAWGDFNADEIEDILISNRQDWIPGTISMVAIEKLTKLSPNGPLVIIKAGNRGD